MSKQYYVYILTNKRDTVLYTGITNNLVKRVWEHKNKLVKGFTQKYNVDKLIYYEIFNEPEEAITREKMIKGWVRRKKEELIRKANPLMRDLYSNIL